MWLLYTSVKTLAKLHYLPLQVCQMVHGQWQDQNAGCSQLIPLLCFDTLRAFRSFTVFTYQLGWNKFKVNVHFLKKGLNICIWTLLHYCIWVLHFYKANFDFIFISDFLLLQIWNGCIFVKGYYICYDLINKYRLWIQAGKSSKYCNNC